MRTCRTCNTPKPDTEYYRANVNKDGLSKQCKACTSARSAVEYLERVADLGVGRARQMLNNARARAAKTGIEFNLSLQWAVDRLADGHCEVTALPFTTEKGPWSPSIDRIDAGRGYTHDNVQMVVWLYNTAKNKYDDADVMRLAAALMRPRGRSFGTLEAQNGMVSL